MVKIYERLLSTNILREKRRDSFDPQRKNLLAENGICIVNLLEIPRVMVFFFKQKTAYEIGVRLVGSEMCIRDSGRHCEKRARRSYLQLNMR